MAISYGLYRQLLRFPVRDRPLIENFSLDDPQLHEERRIEWEGRYYARGISLVIEADGLGGSCSLKEFHQGAP
ncbi:MAG: hypothetical protein P8163_22285 [Candidatus Thiodiazotropha sp.]